MTATLSPGHSSSGHFPIDWELIWVILGAIGIVFLEIVIVVAYIRFHNLRSKARWRRLRERGVVIVDGPTLIWADDLAPQPTFSTFNLRQFPQESHESVV